jgi:hypothetical protein
MMANSIPKREQQNMLENFWLMLQECEAKAERDNGAILKHWVDQWYQIWNRINESTMKPRWAVDKANQAK